MSSDREYVIVRFAMLLALPKGDFHQEAENVQNRWFNVLSQDRAQSDDYHAKKA